VCSNTLEESKESSLRTDESLVSQPDVHNIHTSELWIPRKGFGPLVYSFQDTAVCRSFLVCFHSGTLEKPIFQFRLETFHKNSLDQNSLL